MRDVTHAQPLLPLRPPGRFEAAQSAAFREALNVSVTRCARRASGAIGTGLPLLASPVASSFCLRCSAVEKQLPLESFCGRSLDVAYRWQRGGSSVSVRYAPSYAATMIGPFWDPAPAPSRLPSAVASMLCCWKNLFSKPLFSHTF